MLRKIKWQIPGEPLVAQYKWCQGLLLGHGPVVEKQCIITLSSLLCPGLPSDLSLQIYPPKPCMHLASPSYQPHALPNSFFDLITQTIFGEEYRSLSFSLCNCLHSPATSSLGGPSICLSILFSSTLHVTDQDSNPNPYQTTGKSQFCIFCSSHF